MIAIETKYIPCTNTRPSRIKAYTESGRSVIVSQHGADSVEESHDRAARALCDKMGWHGVLVKGGTKRGYAYIFAESHHGGGHVSHADKLTV